MISTNVPLDGIVEVRFITRADIKERCGHSFSSAKEASRIAEEASRIKARCIGNGPTKTDSQKSPLTGRVSSPVCVAGHPQPNAAAAETARYQQEQLGPLFGQDLSGLLDATDGCPAGSPGVTVASKFNPKKS